MRFPLLLALAAILLAGCSSPQSVHLRDDSFTPEDLSLGIGDAVQFTNDGPSKHTVTIHDPDFATVLDKELAVGASTTYTFSKPGSYHVFCRLHDNMALSVKVA